MTAARKTMLLTVALTSCVMSFLLSGFFSWLHVGVSLAWLGSWAQGFAMAWPLAFTLSLLIRRPVGAAARRLAARL
jgi:Protein of unknown function (DUF2798)